MQYFSETTTHDLPDQDGEERRPGDWFICGMYRQTFLEQHGGARRFPGGDCKLYEQRYVRGNRLYASIAYCTERGEEQLAWLLYLPARCEEQAARLALHCLQACAAFEDWQRPDEAKLCARAILAKQA